MSVGSIGETLLPYEESDKFISTDTGIAWQMVRRDAHKYKFGDKGSTLVVMNNEDGTDNVRYSLDLGKSWCVPRPRLCLIKCLPYRQDEIRHWHQIPSEGVHDPPWFDLAMVPVSEASSAERPDKDKGPAIIILLDFEK